MRSTLARLFTLAGGLLASGQLASAQPAPMFQSDFPPTFPRTSTAGMVAAPGSHSVSQAGCANCSPTATLADAPTAGHGLGHGQRSIGEGCASQAGCSSYAAERTFFWGGCNQFFNPGSKCGGGIFGGRACGGGGGLFGKHDIYPPGPGGLTNPNPCVYGSYINR